MKTVMPFCLLCLVPLMALPEASLASPPAGGGKFAAADADKDGFLSREEFAAAFPGLKSAAFAAIDANGDGRISAEEWRAFSLGHGREGMAMPPAGQDALPLLPVPRNAPAPGDRENLPLLSPPGK